MADQNQGASIEAERAEFEAWAKEVDYENLGGEFAGPGKTGWWYWDDLTAAAWDAWQASAARRSVPPAAGGLPPLPKRSALTLTMPDAKGIVEVLWEAPEHSTDKTSLYTWAQVEQIQREAQRGMFTVEQVQTMIAADRAQRKQAGQVGAEPVRHEIRLVAPGGIAGPWDACDKERFERFKANPGVGDGFKYEVRALYLAAPASAQPADPFSQFANREHTAYSAQPDQRESAAIPKDGRAVYEDWVSHGNHLRAPKWHDLPVSTQVHWTKQALHGAAAPSPAEQPVAKDGRNAPKCWCHTCNKDRMVGGFPYSMTTMILCPTCGNKRCPHASDHTLACTGSNEPGQPGSVYGSVAGQEGEQPTKGGSNG
jgi:hypothetical protein